MKNEFWKSVKGFEGFYEVSNFGRVRSIDRININSKGVARLLKGKYLSNSKTNGNGYHSANLCKDGSRFVRYIHRIVAEVFSPNPSDLPEVNHIDGNKSNNHISNLEWCSMLNNKKHASKNGLLSCGESHHHAKLTDEEADEIRDLALNEVWPQTTIANLYGICQQTVSNIKLGKIRRRN